MHYTVPQKIITLFFYTIFIFICMVSTSHANKYKTQQEAISFLNEAISNTNKAENLSFDYNANITTPLADANLNFKGKYAQPFYLSGDFSGLLDIWIADTKLNLDSQIYIEENSDNDLIQYLKINTPLPNSSLEANKWYTHTTKLNISLSDILAKEKQTQSNKLIQNIKYINMYDINNNQSKIHMIYTIPFLSQEDIEQILLYSQASTNNEKNFQDFRQTLLDTINENPDLKTALNKPHDVISDIIIDKNTMQIIQVNNDLTNYMRELLPDIMDSWQLEKSSSSTEDSEHMKTFTNIAKNYVSRSNFIINCKIYDINTTVVDTPSKSIRDNAEPFPENIIVSTAGYTLEVNELGSKDDKDDLVIDENNISNISMKEKINYILNEYNNTSKKTSETFN